MLAAAVLEDSFRGVHRGLHMDHLITHLLIPIHLNFKEHKIHKHFY